VKVVARISLSDSDRVALQRFLSAGSSKKPASRAQVLELIDGAMAFAVASGQEIAPASSGHSSKAPASRPRIDLEAIDPEDADVLEGKSVGFIRGWNMIKRRKQRAAG
jgi:hypothetical protein